MNDETKRPGYISSVAVLMILATGTTEDSLGGNGCTHLVVAGGGHRHLKEIGVD